MLGKVLVCGRILFALAIYVTSSPTLAHFFIRVLNPLLSVSPFCKAKDTKELKITLAYYSIRPPLTRRKNS